MKKKFVEEYLKSAEVGYMTKDEYRVFQEKLKLDQELKERVFRVLLQEDLSDLGNEIADSKSEGNIVTDNDA